MDYKLWIYVYLGMVSCVHMVMVPDGLEPIECDFAVNILPIQNATYLDILLNLCLGDARCTELYRQTPFVDINNFIHLVQTSSLFPHPLMLDYPLTFLCNSSMYDINNAYYLLALKYQLLESKVLCAINTGALFVIQDNEVICKPFADKLASSPCKLEAFSEMLGILILIGLASLIFLFTAKVCLSYYTLTQVDKV